MDRMRLRKHLDDAHRHIAEGEAHIERQRELIRTLERDGHDTTQAQSLLEQFEYLLRFHREDRDRISRELFSTENSN